MPEQPHNFMWRYILLRSAGWLAHQSGHYEEAASLAQVGLNGTPPSIEKSKLEDLLLSSQQKIDQKTSTQPDKYDNKVSGFLASVDLISSKIYIRQLGVEQLVYIIVAKDKIRDIARLFIGDIVQIVVKENVEGVKFLEEIKRAA